MIDKDEIIGWLKCDDKARLEDLWNKADSIRREMVGDAIHLRGLVEISNHCERDCLYCGIRAHNRAVPRYRMEREEILGCARKAVQFGFGTLVMQAGEDRGLEAEWMAETIRQIKQETSLAITLSLGERDMEEYRLWREAGADRALLRFETGRRDLYDQIHPPLAGVCSDRLTILQELRNLGYEIGSGVMIGIPGQTYEDLAEDILSFRRLDLDMIGVGPYISHPGTPLAKIAGELAAPAGLQVPATTDMGYRVIALARIVCPQANIPSTTALATLDGPTGREQGLQKGANIIMPNLTPRKYRQMYEIYPAKAASTEEAEESCALAFKQIAALGRVVGKGRGDSPNLTKTFKS
ncbi:MAG: [FeFe] hydrogenase H-cluster radical SAM maturase HydE [Syntrophotaleaceae bacterium]